MKRLLSIPFFVLSLSVAPAQEVAWLPSPDAKTLAMGGVAMTTLSGSHPIYSNPAIDHALMLFLTMMLKRRKAHGIRVHGCMRHRKHTGMLGSRIYSI